MKNTVTSQVTTEIVICDICHTDSTTSRMHKCYGCRKDICDKCTRYEDLMSPDNTVHLCTGCIETFRAVKEKARNIVSSAWDTADKMIEDWRLGRKKVQLGGL